MKNYIVVVSFIGFLVLLHPKNVLAESSYVLPYPSYMPGSSFYKIHLVQEKIEKYWYFGNFGQFIYNLKEADKYLVEAKTLFEYKQYLLAVKALEKSNTYFIDASRILNKTKLAGKNISEKENILKEASLKHQEVLRVIKEDIPEDFIWSPEKIEPTHLLLWKNIDVAIAVRESCI